MILDKCMYEIHLIATHTFGAQIHETSETDTLFESR